jgi:hypothetical protein
VTMHQIDFCVAAASTPGSGGCPLEAVARYDGQNDFKGTAF